MRYVIYMSLFLLGIQLKLLPAFNCYQSPDTKTNFLLEPDSRVDYILMNIYQTNSQTATSATQRSDYLYNVYLTLCQQFGTVDFFESGSMRLFPAIIPDMSMVRLEAKTFEQIKLFAVLKKMESKERRFISAGPHPPDVILSDSDLFKPIGRLSDWSKSVKQSASVQAAVKPKRFIVIYGNFDLGRLLSVLPQLRSATFCQRDTVTTAWPLKDNILVKGDTLRVLLTLPSLSREEYIAEQWFKALLEKYLDSQRPQSQSFIDLPWTYPNRYFLLRLVKATGTRFQFDQLTAFLSAAQIERDLYRWYFREYVPIIALERFDAPRAVHLKFLEWYFFRQSDGYFRVYPPNAFPRQKIQKRANAIIRRFVGLLEGRNE